MSHTFSSMDDTVLFVVRLFGLEENPWFLAGHILMQVTNWACRFDLCLYESCMKLASATIGVNDVTRASAPMKRMMSLGLRPQWSEWCHSGLGPDGENDVSRLGQFVFWFVPLKIQFWRICTDRITPLSCSVVLPTVTKMFQTPLT